MKAALIKDGWTVTHDPYRLEYGGRDVYVDLAAERDGLDTVIAAEPGARRIAVEIKTFTGPSVLTDLHQAIGQYALYRTWMGQADPERVLYLAVDEEAATGVFDQAFGRIVADDLRLRLIVVDILTERLIAWRHFPTTDR